jgi:sugar lactone lactonase YvrE
MAQRTIGTPTALCVTTMVVALLACSSSPVGVASAAEQPSSTPAIGTHLAQPEDLVFDGAGNLYVSEFGGHVVDRISHTGSLTIFAGTGVQGYAGDGGPAADAELNMPSGVLVRPDGVFVLADHRNDCIRQIDSTGTISSVVGTCTKHGDKGDGGPAGIAKLDDPIGITQDADGNLYIADEQNAVVRKVDTNGTITRFVGGGRIPVQSAPNGTRATDLKMSHTSYVLADGQGDVYVSDFWANVVIEVLRDGRILRVAGTGTAGFSGDRGCAVDAELDFPTGLALDTYGRLYISDAFNNRVRMVNPRGIIDTVAGSGPTGSGNGSYSGDGGPATMATLNAPAGLAFDSSDNLYIADQGNDRVRMVSRGVISLVAGMPAPAVSVAPRGISVPPKGAGRADPC